MPAIELLDSVSPGGREEFDVGTQLHLYGDVPPEACKENPPFPPYSEPTLPAGGAPEVITRGEGEGSMLGLAPPQARRTWKVHTATGSKREIWDSLFAFTVAPFKQARTYHPDARRSLPTFYLLMRKSERKSIIARSLLAQEPEEVNSGKALYNATAPKLRVFNTKAMSAAHDVTHLLARWAHGDEQALDDLTPLVYAELRKLAASRLRRERISHTLQPTALVHEAYLRLVDQKNPNWQNRSHFFGVAARLMRQILVDHARGRKARKRAGQRVSLEDALSFQQVRNRDLVALDNSLRALEKLDPRKCRAVELRYFGGLSMDEIAQALEISAVTVRRDLRMAEAWLNHEMQNR